MEDTVDMYFFDKGFRIPYRILYGYDLSFKIIISIGGVYTRLLEDFVLTNLTIELFTLICIEYIFRDYHLSVRYLFL